MGYPENMSWLARLKRLISRFVCIIEFCHACGIRQPLVWWCGSDELWKEVTEEEHGGGIFCPKCFDALAANKGIAIRFIATEDYRFGQH